MNSTIPSKGAVNAELAEKAVKWWMDAAMDCNVDLSGFDPKSTLEERTAWALENAFDVGGDYARYSTKMQKSTEDQVREDVQWAAKNRIYVPPEYISVDEGVKGMRIRRDGLNRVKAILRAGLISVLLIYKASRLFRQAGKGYQFINEEVVEEGLRAVIVSQGIDTEDRKTWKMQLQVHGIMDEMLLDAIADHVRTGLEGLFLKNWTTGAIGVGYRRKVIPNAPLTNRERPRTMPEVDPEAADLIREHAKLLLDGMPIREGLRRWKAADGPVDPRSTTKKMNYQCYRRLFTNPRLTGRWEFGRKRNQFSTKLDYVQQIDQPDSEVVTLNCEELRILDDATHFALVVKFDKLKTGPRGPKKDRPVQLWDLTTEMFYCESCSQTGAPVRFYQTGANGHGMQCKNGDDCARKSTVRRKDSVQAICKELAKLIAQDSELSETIFEKTQQLASKPDGNLEKKLKAAKKQLSTLANRVNDLFELTGEGSEQDRKETKAKLRAAQVKRNSLQSDVNGLQRQISGAIEALTAEEIRCRLSEMSELLEKAAAGELGGDSVYKALAVFRAVTGGEILVRVEKRVNRKGSNVLGIFKPDLLRCIAGDHVSMKVDSPEICVWLRKPPRLDLIAERVHELVDGEGLSYREAAKCLRKEGHNVNSGNVWYSYQRWYEMNGTQPPKVAYNNGKKRRSA